MLHLDNEEVEGEVSPRGATEEEDTSLSPQQCSHLQEGAVPEATPDMQHSRTVKAVEWAAEYNTVGRVPGTVLGTRKGRALSCEACRGPAPLLTWTHKHRDCLENSSIPP